MNWTIRTWLCLAAVIILLPMMGFLSISIAHIEGAEQAIIDGEVRYQTSRLVQVVNEHIAVSIQALEVLAKSKNARNKNWAGLYEDAKALVVNHGYFSAITLADDANNLDFVTSIPYGYKTFSPRYPNLVHEVFETGRANISGPFKVPISDGYKVAASIPIIQDNKTIKVLRIVVKTDYICEILKNQNLPKGWIVAIADREGRIIARTENPEKYIGEMASPTFMAAIKRNEKNIFKGITLEGKSTIAFIAPVFHGDWFVTVGVPVTILKDRYRKSLINMALLAIAAIIVAFGVIYIMANFMSKQIRALEAVVSSRDLNVQLPSKFFISELLSVYKNYKNVLQDECDAQKNLTSETNEKNLIRDLYDNAPCGYHSLAVDGTILRMNKTELNWFGLIKDEAVGQPITKFYTKESKEKFESNFPIFLKNGHIEDLDFEIVRKDGSIMNILVSGRLIKDSAGNPVMSSSTVVDITERKNIEKKLQELSNNDSLTKLSNRRYFYELANIEISRARRQSTPLAFAMLDIDNFKNVNDQNGHAAGDKVLANLGRVLKEQLRTIDVIARVGGEEFAFVLPNTNENEAAKVLNRLRETISQSAALCDDGKAVSVTVSIGLTEMRAGEASLDKILARSDAALFEAKHGGRNQVRIAS